MGDVFSHRDSAYLDLGVRGYQGVRGFGEHRTGIIYKPNIGLNYQSKETISFAIDPDCGNLN